MIKGQKTTFHHIKFLCEKRDGHSKRERMKIIDLHLPPPIPEIMAIFRLTSRDMPRDLSEVPILV